MQSGITRISNSKNETRKRVEEIFAWRKMIGLMRKVRQRGRKLVEGMFTYTAAAYNLMRMLKLTEASA